MDNTIEQSLSRYTLGEIENMHKIEKNIAPGASEKPRTDQPGTSDKVKCFRRHCLRCRKYFNHRHTPAEFNTPCSLCPCTYFYGWEQQAKKFGIKPKDFAARRKAPETTEQFAGETPVKPHLAADPDRPVTIFD